MNIYHYHPETGVLIGQSQADPSPLEPGVWLIPAYATTDQPPVPGEGEYVVRINGIWETQPIPDPPTPAPPEPSVPPTPPTPPISTGYITFWDALLDSAVYASIRTQSMASLPMNTLATEFIALIGDAKAGRPNEAAIQASIAAILSTGTFTEADLQEFAAVLEAGRLDDIYALN